MSQSNDNNPLIALSDAMGDAVAKAGAATLLVDARRRLPASGIAFSTGGGPLPPTTSSSGMMTWE